MATLDPVELMFAAELVSVCTKSPGNTVADAGVGAPLIHVFPLLCSIAAPESAAINDAGQAITRNQQTNLRIIFANPLQAIMTEPFLC